MAIQDKSLKELQERLSKKIRNSFSVGGNVSSSLGDVGKLPDVNLQTSDLLSRVLVSELTELVKYLVESGVVNIPYPRPDLSESNEDSPSYILEAESTNLLDSEQIVRNNPENPVFGRVSNIVACTKNYHTNLVSLGEDDSNTFYLIMD